MARPKITGTYAVPKEILDLKPEGISCNIKVIVTLSKNNVPQKHYYVYESRRTGSGKIIGKMEGGRFCPNRRGIELLQKMDEEKKNPGSDKREVTEKQNPGMDKQEGTDMQNPERVSPHLSGDVLVAVKEAADGLHLDMDQVVLQVKDYGEYAMVLASTEAVLRRLEKYFSEEDAIMIYALSIICFVQEYSSGGNVKDIYDASILSNMWPTLNTGEHEVGSFLELLGRHPVICEKYSQGLLNEAAGLIAMDGRGFLECSKEDDAADYGNTYQDLEDKQYSILQAYDVIGQVPLTSLVYGDLLDHGCVQDFLGIFQFPSRTIFVSDMAFYTEKTLSLYREGGKHFVIPVPESATISKAMRSSITFTGSFTYQKTDENGLAHETTILYRESTVGELEDIYQTIQDEQNKEAEKGCPPGEKSKKYSDAKEKRSAYGDERVIMFRDAEIQRNMGMEYCFQIGRDAQYTEENFEKLEPAFGMIILRTNLEGKQAEPSTLFCEYKKRWTIQTHYNFAESLIQYCALKTLDYCFLQGICFLMITVGQVKSAFMKKMASSSSQYARGMSIQESLTRASRFKVVQDQDQKWRISMVSKKEVELLQEMGVDVAGDLNKLNKSQS